MLRRGGGQFKYHFSATVRKVELREGVASSNEVQHRIMWKKGDKVASTREVATDRSTLAYDETLSLVITMYRSSDRGSFAQKEASFTLLCCRKGKSAVKPLGRATVDLARFAGLEPTSTELELVLLHDGVPVGELILKLSSRWLRNYSRGPDGTASLVSDSGSERSLSMSDAGSESSGWPTADEDTEDSVSEAHSDSTRGRGHDVGSLSELNDLDTEDELDLIEGAQRALRGNGHRGQPSGSRAGASRFMPRLRFSTKGSARGTAKHTTGALEEAEARAEMLEGELLTVQEAGWQATVAAERAMIDAVALTSELSSLETTLVRSLENADASARAVAAEVSALRASEACHRAELMEEVEKAKDEARRANDALEATRDALQCLEQAASAVIVSNPDDQSSLADAIAAQVRAEAAVTPALEAVAAADCRAAAAANEKCHAEAQVAVLSREVTSIEGTMAQCQAAWVIVEQQRRELRAVVTAERCASSRLEAACAALATAAAAHNEATKSDARGRILSLLAHARVFAQTQSGSRQERGGEGGRAAAVANELFALGMSFNEAGESSRAKAAFEGAFVLQPRPSLLLSMANMALKVCEPWVALHAYRLVLRVSAKPNDKAEPTAADEIAGTAGTDYIAMARADDASADEGALQDANGLMPPASEREVAMARRKLQEAEAMVAAIVAAEGAILDVTGMKDAPLDAQIRETLLEPEAAKPAAAASEAAEEVGDPLDALLSTQAELATSRQECTVLKAEVARLSAAAVATAAAASRSTRMPQGSGSQPIGQGSFLERELQKARLATAVALGEKAVLARELTEQQRLQRKARMQNIRDREKASALEVKLALALQGDS